MTTQLTRATVLSLAAILLAGCAPSGASDPHPAPAAVAVETDRGDPIQETGSDAAPAAEVVTQGDALVALGDLPVKGRAPKTGYDRDLFGAGWLDPDANGCDGRNDTLGSQLTEVTYKVGTNNCVVLSGVLADPYSGRRIDFVRGQDTSLAVQIDHVVALSDSWQKGAQQWEQVKREAFANDPLNLLAVDGPLNGQKSDGDAATWLPPNKAGRCDYVARQVAVKAKWGLWVTAAERDAIAGVLEACPGQALPADAGLVGVPTGAAPAPGGAVIPEAAPAPYPGVVEPFVNCAAARAAGAAPVLRGDPGYGPHLDADGDGRGCQ